MISVLKSIQQVASMHQSDPHSKSAADTAPDMPDEQPCSSEIKFHICGKRQNGGVIALCLVALFLLIAVTTIFTVIICRSAIVTSKSGRLSLVIGSQKNVNPFAPSSAAVTSVPVESAPPQLDINDPPEVITTSPVESDGVLSTPEIAKRIRPSVVSILVSNARQSGLASGIIMTQDGFIITNNHVVAGMTTITVVLSDGTQYDALLIGRDESSDLAVVKIAAEGLKPATFGNSDALEVGDRAVVVGTPYSLSLSGTTTQGIISAINRDLIIENRSITLIQTDASINPGNSGGPLVNEYGQVVGITSLKVGEEFEGLGFAIPMNTAKSILEELITSGHVKGKPALGINGRFLEASEAAANSLPVGLYVTAVDPKSSAAWNGLTVGDVITRIDGLSIPDLAAFINAKNAHEVGDVLVLTVYRDTNLYDRLPGSLYEISVTLMDESLLNS